MNAQLGHSGNQGIVFIKSMVQHIFIKALLLGIENTEVNKM